jgi:dUTP pyrophosphatase
MIELRFKKLHPEAVIPTRAYPTDSGLDLQAFLPLRPEERAPGLTRFLRLEPEETKVIPTGVCAEVSEAGVWRVWGATVKLPKELGFELQIRPRSSLSAKGIMAMFGTVDAGYRGELKVTLSNQTRERFEIRHGDRIAQLVVAPVLFPTVREVDELTPSPRGGAGYGSTGR